MNRLGELILAVCAWIAYALQEMRYGKKYALLIIAALSFVLRVVVPVADVYRGCFVNFPGHDSYWRALQFKEYFADAGIDWGTIQHIIIYVPPFLAALTVVMVFLITARLFNSRAGLIAAGAVAVFPGEYFARSLLGCIDHHVLEVFLTTFIMLCVTEYITTKDNYERVIAGIMIAGAVAVLYKMWPGAQSFLTGALSGQPYDLTLATNIEARPLLQSSNLWPFMDALITLVGSLLLWRWRQGWKRYLVIAWAVVMLVATFWQVRFDYYLVIPAAVLAGFVIDKTINKSKPEAIAIGIFLILVMIPTYIGMIKSDLDTPSTEWNKNLTWIKQNTSVDSVILTWWDYGYWVEYVAEREAYITPGQDFDRVIETSKILLDYGAPELPAGVDYLIIDERMVFDYNIGMAIWAGAGRFNVDENRTLLGRLWWGELGNYHLIKDGEIKIYRMLALE